MWPLGWKIILQKLIHDLKTSPNKLDAAVQSDDADYGDVGVDSVAVPAGNADDLAEVRPDNADKAVSTVDRADVRSVRADDGEKTVDDERTEIDSHSHLGSNAVRPNQI